MCSHVPVCLVPIHFVAVTSISGGFLSLALHTHFHPAPDSLTMTGGEKGYLGV